MTEMRFVAVPATAELVGELSVLDPTNPFATWGYFEARHRLGDGAWVLAMRDGDGRLICGCGGFLGARRFFRKLEIWSLPWMDADSPFWAGMLRFCEEHRVSKLVLGTFASPQGVAIPTLNADCTRRRRCEFVLDLDGDAEARLERRHRHRVRQAEKAGLVITRTRSLEAVGTHRLMMGLSMDRRRARGEKVPSIVTSAGFEALLQSGAGELYLALRGQTVVASGLVLLAPKGAYFDSRGTSPEGMKVGASHLLTVAIMRQLRQDGVRVFNLGGADEGSTLAQFKQKFGARLVPLPAAEYLVGPSWRRRADMLVDAVVLDRRALLSRLAAQVADLEVFVADTGTAQSPEAPAGVVFRALTEEDLRASSFGDPALKEAELGRLRRFGRCRAYGVFVDGTLANVSWLLSAESVACDEPRWLMIGDDEAMIAAVSTLPGYRGRGLYILAARELLVVARERGIQRVFLKAQTNNEIARSGALKAGFRRLGSGTIFDPPLMPRMMRWRAADGVLLMRLPISSAVALGGSASRRGAAGSRV